MSDRLGEADLDFTLASSAADLTGNGHTDLHVGNDATADYIYENKGNGSFERIDLGPASDRNAMSSSVIDVSGNHRLDIFTTNIYYDNPDVERYVPVLGVVALPLGNTLFLNSGDTGFTDVAPEHGLHRGSWGWASTVADYTNDGHLDVIHASSYVDPPVVGNHSNIYKYPQVWKGTTDSWKKVNGSSIGFSEHNLRGVARVDYDNDGALDFVAPGVPESGLVPGLEAGQNETFLYENQREGSESLQLFVRNPDGLSRNAEVYVETDERTVYRVANARGDLLSQNSRLIHIGTANESVEQVTVEWPDGAVSSYDNVESGHRYVLTPDVAKTVG